MDGGPPKRFPLRFKSGVHRREHPMEACLAGRGRRQGTRVGFCPESGPLPGDRRQQPLRVNSSGRHRSDNSRCCRAPWIVVADLVRMTR